MGCAGCGQKYKKLGQSIQKSAVPGLRLTQAQAEAIARARAQRRAAVRGVVKTSQSPTEPPKE